MWTPEEAIPPSVKARLDHLANNGYTNPSVFLIAFLEIISELKKCERTGWVQRSIPKPESVADHMYRMSIICLLNANAELNSQKCALIALCHDMAEALVGDITPFDPTCGKEEKHRRELAAMEFVKSLVSKVNPAAGQMLYDLWCEYEYQSTDEARFVKDVDKFELLLQTSEYLRMHPKADINEMMRAKSLIHTEAVADWVNAMEEYNSIREG